MERFTAVDWRKQSGPHSDTLSHVRGGFDHVLSPSHPPHMEHSKEEIRSQRDRFITQNSDGERRFNFDLPTVKTVESYIDTRVKDFTIRAEVRNQKLLNTDPFFKKIGIETPTQLSAHMIEDKKKYTDEEGIYYLPYDDIPPNAERFRMRFNWDSEMHIHAILESKIADKVDIAKGVIGNAMYLFDIKGYVPNAAAEGYDDRTQPPRHTKMIQRVEDSMTPSQRQRPENKEFFDKAWDFAEKEYWSVFNAKDPQNPYSSRDQLKQNVEVDGVIHPRYGAQDMPYNMHAELASGWDMTDRFNGRAGEHSPIDLEVYLLTYEKDFAKRARKQGDTKKEEMWNSRYEKRFGKIIDHHLGEDGWFYDYDFVNKRQSTVSSLAGFLMYDHVKDPALRTKMRNNLKEKYLYDYGLVLSTEDTLPQIPNADVLAKFDEGSRLSVGEIYKERQWRFPNQFFNLTSQAVDSLMAAGDNKLAINVMENALVGMTAYQEKHGKLPEKLNVITGKIGHGAEYGDQKELVMPFGAYMKFAKDLPRQYEMQEQSAQRFSHEPVQPRYGTAFQYASA